MGDGAFVEGEEGEGGARVGVVFGRPAVVVWRRGVGGVVSWVGGGDWGGVERGQEGEGWWWEGGEG